MLEFYAAWNRTLPDEMASAATFRNFPPLPTSPKPLRGQTFIAVRGCYCGDDLDEGPRLIEPVRAGARRARRRHLRDHARRADGRDQHGPGRPDRLLLPFRAAAPTSRRRPSRRWSSWPGPTQLTPDQVGAAPARRGALRSGRRAEPDGAQRRPVHHERDRGDPHARAWRGPVRSYLAHLAEAVRPYATGTTYVNFMDLDGATPERVRAAYSPDDWKRLVELKDRHDPHNLFRFNRNIPPSIGGMQTMNRILVTGATGTVGSHLVQLLRGRGAPVRAFVRDRDRAVHALGAGRRPGRRRLQRHGVGAGGLGRRRAGLPGLRQPPPAGGVGDDGDRRRGGGRCTADREAVGARRRDRFTGRLLRTRTATSRRTSAPVASPPCCSSRPS